MRRPRSGMEGLERTDFVAPARRHIIKRPRLTRLLDETSARIIMLVAPAGYGKTTLAREWSGEATCRVAWYAATDAATDVIVLTRGLAAACQAVQRRAGERALTRVSAAPISDDDVVALAEVFAEDLRHWPDGTWLVIDDYQNIVGSATAERFTAAFVELSRVRILIASRERPSWATARQILYGEIEELGRASLAFSQIEANEVLKDKKLPGLFALADGWPAVIGLAALTHERATPIDVLSKTLYDFFAQELLEAVADDLRIPLYKLALLERISLTTSTELVGPLAERAIAAGLTVGAIAPATRGDYELHPLLREFLINKLQEGGAGRTEAVVCDVGLKLISAGRWDNAFSLAERFDSAPLLRALLDAAVPALIDQGRVGTLQRWVGLARRFQLESPAVDLADAKLALSEGDYERARLLSLAACSAAPSSTFKAQALISAGSSSIFADDYRESLQSFTAARDLATSERDLRDALWGQFISANLLELPQADDLLAALRAFDDKTAEHKLRVANAAYSCGVRGGCVADALGALRAAYPLCVHAQDPFVKTSFLNMYARCLALSGLFVEALEATHEEIDEAARYKLPFVEPSALATQAIANQGLRMFAEAHRLLRRLDELVERGGDVHGQLDARAIRARVLLAQGRARAAVAVSAARPRRTPSASMWGEYLATHALALACVDDMPDALRTRIEMKGPVP